MRNVERSGSRRVLAAQTAEAQQLTAEEEARSARMTRLGIWIAALSLAALAGLQVADKLF